MEIAITGIGMITALGAGSSVNHQQLLRGESALRSPQILPTKHKEWPIGEVRYTNMELADLLQLQPQERELSRNILLGLVALREALADAALTTQDCAEIPLLNGSTVGGMDLTEKHYSAWAKGDYKQLFLIEQHEAHYTSKKMCEMQGLKNAVTISTACSSALNALIHGIGLLLTGEATRVVVGGTEAMTCFHLNGFSSLGILSQHVCRPFQENRDGINLGEGAAYLVLEDAQLARARGQHIYGYIAGYGNRCDAYHQTASSPEGDGALDAMQMALSMGHLSPELIPYINAHGTATPNNDASELRAIERLTCGAVLPRIESTKTLTGHTTSASGSIEAIYTLFRMADCNYPYAITNAFGFGGNDSSLVLSTTPVNLSVVAGDGSLHSTSVYESTGDWDYKGHIPPMQARRMSPLIRQLIIAANKAIEEAGVSTIDGIVVGTRWGGMLPTMQLLNQYIENGEDGFSPAQFMNSTHNSAAGTLARILLCKGYNTTVVDTLDSFNVALKDAKLAIRTGIANRVLVCYIDELEERWEALCKQQNIETISKVKAKVIWQD